MWYLEQTAVQDEETQKQGIITVICNFGVKWREKFDKESAKLVARLTACSPLRNVATHYCYSDPAFGAIIAFVSLAFERRSRTRTKLHRGTHVEVRYKLMSFGIPVRFIPVEPHEFSASKEHRAFLQRLQILFRALSSRRRGAIWQYCCLLLIRLHR